MEYDILKRRLPNRSKLSKHLICPVLTGLVYWTYPQSVEQSYRRPPALLLAIGRVLPAKFRPKS